MISDVRSRSTVLSREMDNKRNSRLESAVATGMFILRSLVKWLKFAERSFCQGVGCTGTCCVGASQSVGSIEMDWNAYRFRHLASQAQHSTRAQIPVCSTWTGPRWMS